MIALEIGLPFFNNIDKQGRYTPYFNTFCKEWICPKNRFLPFQLAHNSIYSDIDTFEIINIDTGNTTSYFTAYFEPNVDVETVGSIRYYSNPGDVEIGYVIATGRYYFHAANNEFDWYSEVFTITDLEE